VRQALLNSSPVVQRIENPGYSLSALRLTVPEALHSIHGVTLDRYLMHYMRILRAFREGIQDGTKDFQERVQI
jgi:hypothetical protein